MAGAKVTLVDRLDPEDRYDLVVVAMQKASRLAVCPAPAVDGMETPNLDVLLDCVRRRTVRD